MKMTFEVFLALAKEAGLNFRSILADNGNLCIHEVVIDSRKVKANDFFICITGENTDGHNYIQNAVRAGAAALMVQEDKWQEDAEITDKVSVIIVKDTVKALMVLAKQWRSCFKGKVVGITGTAGKTTVKEMLAEVLAFKGKVAKNFLNYNTQIGLSLSILNAKGDEDFWVMEAGISHAKDMDELGSILLPDVALILNAGIGHAEGLPKGSAHYKAQLLKYIPKYVGIGLVNADYPELVKEVRKTCPSALYFTTSGKAVNYRAAYLGLTPDGKGMFRLYLEGVTLDVESVLRSAYGSENVIAIVALAHILGMENTEIVKALSQAKLPKQRFEISEYNNITLIDDSYNSNPLSAARMLEAAAERAHAHGTANHTVRSLICIMGSMLELGENAVEEHEKLGKLLGSAGTKHIFWKGDYAEEVQWGLQRVRYSGSFTCVEKPEEFHAHLKDLNLNSGVFLVKGSRGNKLEYFVQEIKNYYE